MCLRQSGVTQEECRGIVDEHAQAFELGECLDTCMSELSLVNQRLVSICRETLLCSGLVILDDPLEGLDVLGILRILGCLRKLRLQGLTIVFSCNAIPSCALSLLEDVIIIAEDGCVAYQGVASGIESFLHLHGGDVGMGACDAIAAVVAGDSSLGKRLVAGNNDSLIRSIGFFR